MTGWHEKYKPGDWVELRCVWLQGGENDWEKGRVLRFDEDPHGVVVVAEVNGLATSVRAPENIRAAKPPRPAKKRLCVKTGA